MEILIETFSYIFMRKRFSSDTVKYVTDIAFNPISPGGGGLKMHAKFLNA